MLGGFRGAYLCVFKGLLGSVDACTKLCEAVKSKSSPRVADGTDPMLPLVVDVNGAVRDYDEGEAKANYLLTSIAKLDFEFYLGHHVIDVPRAGTGSRSGHVGNEFFRAAAHAEEAHLAREEISRRQVRHILLITTKRVVFGTFKPLRVVFELPVKRLNRVDLPWPHDKLIIWSWHRLPLFLSPMSSLRSSAMQNGIHEREILGAHPHQLRAAFLDLQAISQQQQRGEFSHSEDRVVASTDGHVADGRGGAPGR